MSQSRKSSFIEACMNTGIGYIVSLGGQLIIYPAYGATFTIMQNIYIGLWFMLLSLIRAYCIRRWFNNRIHRLAQTLAKE